MPAHQVVQCLLTPRVGDYVELCAARSLHLFHEEATRIRGGCRSADGVESVAGGLEHIPDARVLESSFRGDNPGRPVRVEETNGLDAFQSHLPSERGVLCAQKLLESTAIP